MANVPGLVTDPSKITGGLVECKAAAPKSPPTSRSRITPGNYPGIVMIHGGIRAAGP